MARTLEKTRPSELARVLRAAGEDLPPPEDMGFGPVFDRFGEARLVLLGEATHGTSEFYRTRAAISHQLIEHHGFNIIAIEADWPDAAGIDRFVRHRPHMPREEAAFARFPSWMWANHEVKDLVDWLRTFNGKRADDVRVEFRGLDVYSMRASIAAVLSYLHRTDPEAAKAARKRYGCLTPWQDSPQSYGRRAIAGLEDCEKQATEQLRELLDHRLIQAGEAGEDFFDAQQNARIVRAAEEYYRAMYYGATESWNLRDRHMFDTLQRLMSRRPNAKAIVWAHNSHIGNAAATAMGWQGEFNIGELARNAYGRDAIAIGFGTDRGTVAAASDWDEPMEIKSVVPARDDSYEAQFRQAGHMRSLTDWRTRNADLRDVLSQPMLERAIGVVYRPDTEFLSHYFRAVLAEQFDAYIWFEETKAVTPLPGAKPTGVPETYPFGL